METLIKKSFAEFKFNPEIPCVEMHWNGFVKSDSFRGILEEARIHFENLKETYPNLGWLADTIKLRVISKEDRIWVENEYNPKLFQSGLQYMAIVMPEEIFGQMSIKDIVSDNDKHVNTYHMKLFDNEKEAKNWLKNVLNT